jgi:hypothetical protein
MQSRGAERFRMSPLFEIALGVFAAGAVDGDRSNSVDYDPTPGS